MKAKPTARKPKKKKIIITLPEREGEMLKAYAKHNGTTCPAAVHRMVRQTLRQFKAEVAKQGKAEPQNQLNIFDSIQVDIFNNTSKVIE